jgi:hypothetical protein
LQLAEYQSALHREFIIHCGTVTHHHASASSGSDLLPCRRHRSLQTEQSRLLLPEYLGGRPQEFAACRDTHGVIVYCHHSESEYSRCNANFGPIPAARCCHCCAEGLSVTHPAASALPEEFRTKATGNSVLTRSQVPQDQKK